MKLIFKRIVFVLFVALNFCAIENRATIVVGPWTPMFKGIDFCTGTNAPGGGMPNLHVVYAMRVDLTDPDVRLKATPRTPSNYLNGSRETVGRTVSDFLTTNRLQIALNANYFSPGTYYPPPGTLFNVDGLQTDEGIVVSTITSSLRAACFLFTSNNLATFIPTNFPAKPTTNIYTAVTGEVALAIDGTNRMKLDLDVQPRTCFGLSSDRKYLYLVAIDGRQPGYSDGATLFECARWILALGASDGINMDGGGSTLLVAADSTGTPIRLSSSSAVAGDGRERVVGSHFGIYAKPIPAFINDVNAIPDDKTAVITWTTLQNANGEVRYGLTTDLELGSVTSDLITNLHSLTLTNLTPATTYFYQVLSATDSKQYASSNFVFVTTNYITTNQIFDLGQVWKYSTASMDGVNWTAPDYDDSSWPGGPAILWVDTRTPPNPNIQNKATQMTSDTTTGFPYVTYYLRTRFELTNLPPETALQLSGYIDDGAAFYINGVKSYSLRVPDNLSMDTIASGFPCSGDADCLDHFTIAAASNTNLIVGTNVLAVEVHNYNARSPDITFGVSLARIEPINRNIQLSITISSERVDLEWSPGAILQSAPAVDGTWEDVDPAPTSPLILQPSEASLFYRLRR
jgi:hypothetical protein